MPCFREQQRSIKKLWTSSRTIALPTSSEPSVTYKKSKGNKKWQDFSKEENLTAIPLSFMELLSYRSIKRKLGLGSD